MHIYRETTGDGGKMIVIEKDNERDSRCLTLVLLGSGQTAYVAEQVNIDEIVKTGFLAEPAEFFILVDWLNGEECLENLQTGE